MSDHSEAYVAFDTSKLRNAVALAEAGRSGEVRFLGEIENRHRTAPDEHPDMRLKSADQSMITDVSRLRPHHCTIITSIASNTDRGGGC